MPVALNSLFTTPTLKVTQDGLGTNLDVTSGQAALVRGLVVDDGAATGIAYNNTVAAGNFIEVRSATPVWPGSWFFPHPGVLFENGLSLDMSAAGLFTVYYVLWG
jgi:hypothetical protein